MKKNNTNSKSTKNSINIKKNCSLNPFKTFKNMLKQITTKKSTSLKHITQKKRNHKSIRKSISTKKQSINSKSMKSQSLMKKQESQCTNQLSTKSNKFMKRILRELCTGMQNWKEQISQLLSKNQPNGQKKINIKLMRKQNLLLLNTLSKSIKQFKMPTSQLSTTTNSQKRNTRQRPIDRAMIMKPKLNHNTSMNTKPRRSCLKNIKRSTKKYMIQCIPKLLKRKSKQSLKESRKMRWLGQLS